MRPRIAVSQDRIHHDGHTACACEQAVGQSILKFTQHSIATRRMVSAVLACRVLTATTTTPKSDGERRGYQGQRDSYNVGATRKVLGNIQKRAGSCNCLNSSAVSF